VAFEIDYSSMPDFTRRAFEISERSCGFYPCGFFSDCCDKAYWPVTCICDTVCGGVVFVTSVMVELLAGTLVPGNVKPQSSNSTLPFCRSRADPPNKENDGARLSTHAIAAVLAASLS